jgi:hypothetical protein
VISHAAVVRENELAAQKQLKAEKANYAIDPLQLADLMEKRKEETKLKRAEQEKKWLQKTKAQAASKAKANRMRAKHQRVYGSTDANGVVDKHRSKKEKFVSEKEAAALARIAAAERLKELEEEKARVEEEEQHAVLESSEERAAREHAAKLQEERDAEQAARRAKQADADRIRALAAKIGLKKDIEILENQNKGDDDDDEEWGHGGDNKRDRRDERLREERLARKQAEREAGFTFSTKVDRYSRKFLERTGVSHKKMVTTHSPQRNFWNMHHEDFKPLPEGWLGPEGWLAGGVHPLRSPPEFTAVEEVKYKERLALAKAKEEKREKRQRRKLRKERKELARQQAVLEQELELSGALTTPSNESVRPATWWPAPDGASPASPTPSGT